MTTDVVSHVGVNKVYLTETRVVFGGCATVVLLL